MPSAEHEALVNALVNESPIGGDTLDEQRDSYRAALSQTPIPEDVTIEPSTIAGCDADWVSVPDSDPAKAILYLHGGGYVIGDNVGYREFAGRMARATGARVCVLNYRLAPESPFPAAVDDAEAAFKEIVGTGIAPEKIAVAGDSAGGGLTVATLLRLRDGGHALPACGLVFSPWVDLALTGGTYQSVTNDPLVAVEGLQMMAEMYAGTNLKDSYASPLYADLAGLPPVLIQVGTREILLDDSVSLAAKLQDAGVTVETHKNEGLIHVWPVLSGEAPESIAALQACRKFADQHWG